MEGIIVRAYDGKRWLTFARFGAGTAGQDAAMDAAIELQDVMAGEEAEPAWLLVEVEARTDATARILGQWVCTPTGYHRVVGR